MINKWNEVPVKACETSVTINNVPMYQVRSIGLSKENAVKLQKFINAHLSISRRIK